MQDTCLNSIEKTKNLFLIWIEINILFPKSPMIDELKKKATLAYESMRVLFCGTDMGAFPFVSQLDTILQIISQKELHLLEFAEKINCLSELCKELSFASQIDRMLFQRLVHI